MDLREKGAEVWPGYIWLWMGSSGRLLWTR